jgi:hypothetical protein
MKPPDATLQTTMLRTTARRFHTIVLVVASLLFAQLALANYVCPGGAEPEAGVMEMASGEPCEGMSAEQDQTIICYQHCTDAPQSFDGMKLPSLSVPVVVQVLLVPLTLDMATQEAAVFADAGQEQPPPEPVFLSTRRLRV